MSRFSKPIITFGMFFKNLSSFQVFYDNKFLLCSVPDSFFFGPYIAALKFVNVLSNVEDKGYKALTLLNCT